MMNSKVKNRISITWICAIIFVLSAGALTSYTQDKLRTLEHGRYRRYDTSNEPIAIVSREIGDGPFDTDSRTMAGRDWLRDLTLGVKNISDAVIKSFEINIIIPRQGGMSADAGLLILYQPTREPVHDANGKLTGEYLPPKVLKPGETVKVKVLENTLRTLDYLSSIGVADIDQASLAYVRVTFDDGTGWNRGMITGKGGTTSFTPPILPGADDLARAQVPSDKQILFPNKRIEPLQILELSTEQTKVDGEQKFKATGDWLKGLSIVYQNNTNRTIISMTVALTFPETGVSGNVMLYTLSVGTPRMAALKGERTAIFKPSESMLVSLDDHQLRKLREFIEQRHLLSSLSKVQVSVQFILFDDYSAWSLGYKIRDPQNPNRWIEAPGHQQQNAN